MVAAISAVFVDIQRRSSGCEAGLHDSPTIVAAIASTANAEGSRAVHSFRTPAALNESAMSQFISGGLRRNGLPPTYGTSQLPVSSMVMAGRMRLPSSPFSSVEPNPGR
jgi:hypothetical protein